MKLIPSISLLAVFSSCGSVPSQTRSVCSGRSNAAQSSLNIEGGVETSEYSSVVLIISQASASSTGKCTGTIVGHNVVLTAAHCLTAPAKSTHIMQTGSLRSSEQILSAMKTAVSPTTMLTHGTVTVGGGKIDSTQMVDDLAVLIFANNTFKQTDITVPSLFKNLRPEQFSPTIMVGYGKSSASDTTSSTSAIKRAGSGSYVISKAFGDGIIVSYARALDPKTLEATGPVKYSSTHQGDSGGPLLFRRNDHLELVGTASAGSVSGNLSSYVDLYSDRSLSLLRQAISKGAKFTETPPSSENYPNKYGNDTPNTKKTNCLN